MYTILFDGVCNFCNSTINFIIDRDPNNQFVFAPLQSETGRQLLVKNRLSADKIDSVVLLKDGKVYDKSDAALEIARYLNGWWPLFYTFKIVPRPVRNLLYDLIAHNRYRWFGKQTTCRIPTPELRKRFLI